jgi:hypothetical protein
MSIAIEKDGALIGRFKVALRNSQALMKQLKPYKY